MLSATLGNVANTCLEVHCQGEMLDAGAFSVEGDGTCRILRRLTFRRSIEGP